MQTQETTPQLIEVSAEARSLAQLAIDRLESLPRGSSNDDQRIWQAVAALEEAKTRLSLVGIEEWC
jgi:hypothetical protein